MSVIISAVVWSRKMKINRKIVLLKMADFANHDGGGVYPSVETLADYSCISERTVARVLQSLREDGIISVVSYRTGKRGRIPVYQIDMARVEGLHPLVGAELRKLANNTASLAVSEANNPDTEAVSQKLKTANLGRLPATHDTTHCHGLADNTSYNRHLDKDAGARGFEKPPPACAHWNSKLPAMYGVIDQEDVCKVEGAIVHSDDGKTIVLWVESEEVREDLDIRLREHLEPVLNRILVIDVNEIVSRAKQRRLSNKVVVNTEDVQVAFAAAKDDMVHLFGAENFESWFGGVQVSGGADGEVLLHCPSVSFRDWITKHYAVPIAELMGREVVVLFGQKETVAAYG